MPIEIVSPNEISSWDDLILSFGDKDYSIFHSLEWSKVLQESYNYKPIYLINKLSNETTAILPFMSIKKFLAGKRLVSLPFSDYCEPLINKKDDFESLINFLISFCENENIESFEIRGGREYFKNVQSAYSYYEHILELGREEKDILKNFNETTRRNIKKAVKEGILTSVDFSLNSLKEFYKLNCITRKKHGLPPQPFSFFMQIFHNLIKDKKAFIISAKYKNKIIASAVYLHFGEKAYYKYGASDERFQNFRPNNLVMWEAIKHYNQRNFKSFHFGRTESENEGLRRFKLGWGTTEKVINTYIYSLNKKGFIKKGTNTSGFHNKIFRNLPIPVLKGISGLIYRYSG